MFCCFSKHVSPLAPLRYQRSENRDIITASIATNAYLVAGRHNLQKNDPSSGFLFTIFIIHNYLQSIYICIYKCIVHIRIYIYMQMASLYHIINISIYYIYISYHIMSCHVMSCHVMSYHIISYHIIYIYIIYMYLFSYLPV